MPAKEKKRKERKRKKEEGSMTGNLEQLKWESLKKRRTDNRLILLCKDLKGKARTPTDDLISFYIYCSTLSRGLCAGARVKEKLDRRKLK